MYLSALGYLGRYPIHTEYKYCTYPDLAVLTGPFELTSLVDIFSTDISTTSTPVELDVFVRLPFSMAVILDPALSALDDFQSTSVSRC